MSVPILSLLLGTSQEKEAKLHPVHWTAFGETPPSEEEIAAYYDRPRPKATLFKGSFKEFCALAGSRKSAAVDPATDEGKVDDMDADDDAEASDGNRNGDVEPDKEAKCSPLETLLRKARNVTHTHPTELQARSGNYRHGRLTFHNLEIALENPKGTTRCGKDKNGKPWEQTMKGADYGYFCKAGGRPIQKGKDDDFVDVFIGPALESEKVFIIDQTDPDTGKFDEHKVQILVDSEKEARNLYLSNYPKGWLGLESITEITIDELKEWLKSGDTKKPYAMKGKKASALDQLLQAKDHSDAKRYTRKHTILRKLLADAPEEFFIDSDNKAANPGLTHKPTGFQIHAPRTVAAMAKGAYSPPMGVDEVKANYPKLLEDPHHLWRAETGVELIHREPSKEELQRIAGNWDLMTPEQKALSDGKSQELFGKSNQEHLQELLPSYDKQAEDKCPTCGSKGDGAYYDRRNWCPVCEKEKQATDNPVGWFAKPDGTYTITDPEAMGKGTLGLLGKLMDWVSKGALPRGAATLDLHGGGEPGSYLLTNNAGWLTYPGKGWLKGLAGVPGKLPCVLDSRSCNAAGGGTPEFWDSLSGGKLKALVASTKGFSSALLPLFSARIQRILSTRPAFMGGGEMAERHLWTKSPNGWMDQGPRVDRGQVVNEYSASGAGLGAVAAALLTSKIPGIRNLRGVRGFARDTASSLGGFAGGGYLGHQVFKGVNSGEIARQRALLEKASTSLLFKQAVVEKDEETGKWILWTKDKSRKLGTHDKPEDAYRQEYAIQKSVEHQKEAAPSKGCLMLSLPESVTKRIQDWSKTLISEDDLAGDGREPDSHVTALYGFSNETSIEDLDLDIRPIEMKFGKIKRFKADDNRPDSDVLVIEVISTELKELNARLKKEHDVTSTYKTFNPHATIAYVKPGALPKLDGLDTFEGETFNSDTLVYSRTVDGTREKKTMKLKDSKKEDAQAQLKAASIERVKAQARLGFHIKRASDSGFGGGGLPQIPHATPSVKSPGAWESAGGLQGIGRSAVAPVKGMADDVADTWKDWGGADGIQNTMSQTAGSYLYGPAWASELSGRAAAGGANMWANKDRTWNTLMTGSPGSTPEKQLTKKIEYASMDDTPLPGEGEGGFMDSLWKSKLMPTELVRGATNAVGNGRIGFQNAFSGGKDGFGEYGVQNQRYRRDGTPIT
jgi:2'-5' RNA ligase